MAATRSRSATFDQLELFRPPPARPRWHDLPEEVKVQVCELTAQMLKAHVDAGATGEGQPEVNHE